MGKINFREFKIAHRRRGGVEAVAEEQVAHYYDEDLIDTITQQLIEEIMSTKND